MRYQIVHATAYRYDGFVTLEPHVIRLRSRCDGWQKLHTFALEVVPEPAGVSQIIDLEGNDLVRVWFQEPTDHLIVKATSEIETFCTNPFTYLLEPWATELPIDYPTSMLAHLQPYLLGSLINGLYGVDPIAVQLAQEITHAVDNHTTTFLSELNQRIYQSCQYVVRETGDPLPAGITWTQKQGSCRDLAVLFIEVCRAVGLAARFVSGYQEGDPEQQERDLHAWAEVYLPGAGWRGYDPTQGLAVSDRHIALVASALPRQAAPITGIVRGGGSQSQMQYHLLIDRIEASSSQLIGSSMHQSMISSS